MRNFWVGLICFFIIILAIYLQLNLFNTLPLFGTKANFGIVLVSAISIFCGYKIGVSFGITYGLISDVMFGKSFGMYILLYFAMGFLVGKINNGFSRDNKSSLLMIVILSTIVFEIVQAILYAICYKYDFALFRFIHVIIFESIYNIILASIIFKPLRSWCEIINKGKSSYYLL